MRGMWSRAAVIVVLVAGCAGGVAAESLTGAQAFARLKALAGDWQGHIGTADGPAGALRWESISGGTAMMETLFPGTAHEMRSVYHLDHGELMLTHYCAAGNQPRMRLDSAASSPERLVFRFDGGTNLDPAIDGHVHEGEIRVLPDGRLDAEWAYFEGGKRAASNRFVGFERRATPPPG